MLGAWRWRWKDTGATQGSEVAELGAHISGGYLSQGSVLWKCVRWAPEAGYEVPVAATTKTTSWGLQTQRHSLPQSGGQKSETKVLAVLLPSGGSEGESWLLVTPGSPGWSLPESPQALPPLPRGLHPSVSVSSCDLHVRAPVIGFRAHPNPVRPHLS